MLSIANNHDALWLIIFNKRHFINLNLRFVILEEKMGQLSVFGRYTCILEG